MAYTKVVLSDEVLYLQDKTYSANSDRKFWEEIISAGVMGVAASFQVTFNSGLSVNIAAGHAAVDGQNATDQGMYRVRSTATQSISVGAGDPTNPRLDQIILRVMDNAVDASGSSEARIEVIPGTPTAGATLVNRNGAASLTTLTEASKSVLLLADVLVPAGAASISSGAIGDKRTFATLGNNISLDASKITGFLPGNQTIQGTLTMSQQVIYSGVAAPASISGTRSDWNPTGLPTAEALKIATSGPTTITGIQGGATGRQLTLHNISANPIFLTSEDTSSSAANRFTMGNNAIFELLPGMSVQLRYDAGLARWRVMLPSPARLLQDNNIATIADQTAISITPTQPIGLIFVWGRVNGYADFSGLFNYRATTTPYCQKIVAANANFDTSTAILTGTTGTAGHFTVSAAVGGLIYLENRLGASRAMGWILMGQ